MTTIQYVKEVLDNEWTESVSNRPNDVPKPKLIIEANAQRRSVDLQQSDVAFLRDGGITGVEAQGFGWTEQSTTSRVTIDLRTSISRERLWGYRQDVQTGERYGGLAGETKRIWDSKRRGDGGFDLIFVIEQNDLSDQMGAGFWRATTELRLETRSNVLDTDP